MRRMDELHLMDPTLGSPRLGRELADLGIKAGREKVRSLMERMRLCCVYRRPRTTVIDKVRYKHPYLLRGLKVERPHQVWAIDITYIPMRGGYMYLCAIIDLHSRYIVGWSVSNTMEAERVCAVVRDAEPGFGVDQLAWLLHLSRSQALRKIKALTGSTPVVLLRDFRLAKAQALLGRGGLTVAEVAYACGFNTPNYFSDVYFRAFGHRPSEAAKP